MVFLVEGAGDDEEMIVKLFELRSLMYVDHIFERQAVKAEAFTQPLNCRDIRQPVIR